MARVKRGVTTHARHKKLLKQAAGYRGRAKNAFRIAIEKVEKGLRYAYRDRKNRKRDFRALWIQRINAGARVHGMTYSRLMAGLTKAGIALDRKVLSDLAVREPEAFKALVEQAGAALAKSA
ncbi:MAG: 50S ribosomal protein L20 [Rhodospirillales bacterium RIFCSPLOWO2_12_FULL_67_15]|nr:MAG: 50S ribosomal protein L20 [Rhodospirillales bacterium RIFCSPLOWO2_12_FULL_67_15]